MMFRIATKSFVLLIIEIASFYTGCPESLKLLTFVKIILLEGIIISNVVIYSYITHILTLLFIIETQFIHTLL